MTTTSARKRLPSRLAIQKFFRTPKGLLTIVFAALLVLGVPVEGARLVAPGLTSAIVAAALVDLVILRYKRRAWEYPSGAVLTGLIVAMVLSPHEPWYVGAATSAIAIVSKYVFRSRSANVFNPAALALVISFYVFGTGQSWWGSLPDAPPVMWAVLVATGAFIAQRVNKLPMVLAFMGTYYALFTITAFVGDPRDVAEVYRTPDLQAALYFAFFILTDPPTSPTRYRDQITCSAIVAVTSFTLFTFVGAVYYLLAGVLVGNIWEAWNRWHTRRRPHAKKVRREPVAQLSSAAR